MDTIFIVVVLGDYSQSDVFNLVTKDGGYLGKISQSLWICEDEMVFGPENFGPFLVIRPAGCEEVDSDLAGLGTLLDGEVFWVSSAQWVDDWLITREGIVEDLELDLDW